MVVVDFIDMVSRMDKLAVLEHFELALEQDKAKPQIGQLSDLGLVELTRHRQGQSLCEIFTKKCDKCGGQGFIIEDLKFQTPNSQGEARAKMNKIKGPFAANFNSDVKPNNNNQKFNKKDKRNRFNKDFTKQQETEETVQNQTEIQEIEIQADVANEQKQQNPTIFDTVGGKVIEIETAKPEENAEVVAEVISQALENPPLEETEEKKPKKVSRKTKKSQKKEALKAETQAENTPTQEETNEESPTTTDEQTQQKPKRTVRRGRKAKNA